VGPHSVAFTACSSPTDFQTNPALPGYLTCKTAGYYRGSDSLGGETLWTGSAELHFPLPVSDDFGLSGRTFIDAGSLFGLKVPENAITNCLPTLQHFNPATGKLTQGGGLGYPVDFYTGKEVSKCYYDDSSARVSAGFGISWKSPFGLINVDIGVPLLKQPYDQLEVFRFGFGTRFQ
jgi:outer membrane protein insertion porin family